MRPNLTNRPKQISDHLESDLAGSRQVVIPFVWRQSKLNMRLLLKSETATHQTP